MAVDPHKAFEEMADTVVENSSDAGIDMVSVFASLVEMVKATNPTIETWELFRLTISNGVGVLNNLIDEEITQLQASSS